MNITNLFSIKTGCDETDRQLQKLFFQLDLQLGELTDQLRKLDSNFVPRSQFVDTLDLNDVEYKEILNYFIFNRNDSEESLVEWLYDWISTNRYELPKEFSIRMAHKYHESVTEVFGDE
ncbi:TPA: ketol-acid reductoisomerase [Streptococcus pneumoniae]|nr:ketol-acid reductoisomerase [Streptococcus pneumoniae]